jgi:hypothetical protein
MLFTFNQLVGFILRNIPLRQPLWKLLILNYDITIYKIYVVYTIFDYYIYYSYTIHVCYNILIWLIIIVADIINEAF